MKWDFFSDPSHASPFYFSFKKVYASPLRNGKRKPFLLWIIAFPPIFIHAEHDKSCPFGSRPRISKHENEYIGKCKSVAMRQRRGMIYHVPLKHKDTHNTRLSMFRAYIKTIQWTINVKIQSQKRPKKNASIRAKNSDEMVFFALSCCRFSLFLRSKHSFYHAKA